jgi:amino acid permease
MSSLCFFFSSFCSVLLCLIRNIRALAPVSAFGLAAVALALCVVLFEGFKHSSPQPSQMQLLPQNYFLFFGMAVFAFEGINLAVPVHSNMLRPNEYGRVRTKHPKTNLFLFSQKTS